MAMERFDPRDLTGLLQREKKFDLFRKGQAKRATEWLTEMLEDFYKKQMKTFKGRVKPWQQTLVKLGGNIIAPGVGSLLGGLTQAYNTIHTHKDYADLIKEVGKKIEIPKWAKGTFMEDYLKTNLLGGQATAKNILAGSQKSSALSGGLGALLDFISAGKGFKAGQDLMLKELNKDSLDIYKTGAKYDKSVQKYVGKGKSIPHSEVSIAATKPYKDMLANLPETIANVIPGMPKTFDLATDPLIDFVGKKGFHGRGGDLARNITNFGIGDVVSELSTPSSWSQYAHKPLIEMLLGPKQETYVPELRISDYKIRRG